MKRIVLLVVAVAVVVLTGCGEATQATHESSCPSWEVPVGSPNSSGIQAFKSSIEFKLLKHEMKQVSLYCEETVRVSGPQQGFRVLPKHGGFCWVEFHPGETTAYPAARAGDCMPGPNSLEEVIKYYEAD